jgi:hypothetical protein
LEIRIRIKIKLQLETLRIVNFKPFDIFEILEGLLITFSDLSHKKKGVTILIINRWKLYNRYINCITSSASVLLFFNAVSQKLGTPFSEFEGRSRIVSKESVHG